MQGSHVQASYGVSISELVVRPAEMGATVAIFALGETTEAQSTQSTQSFSSTPSSVISVPLCFKIS